MTTISSIEHQFNHQEIFFQKQSKFSLDCGRYAVNNLLGYRAFTPKDFDKLCYELSNDFINPHKHIIGGDYDVNVLIMALQAKGYEVQWHDSRKQLLSTQQENKDNKDRKLIGYLLNVKMPQRFYHFILRFSGRHWVSIRSIQKDQSTNNVLLMDSRKDNPEEMQSDIAKFIRQKLENGAHLIKVFQKVQSSKSN